MSEVDILEKLQELASGWIKRGNTNYRMFKMSTLQWKPFIVKEGEDSAEFDIRRSRIACARNGGPIAVMKQAGDHLFGSKHLLREHIGIFNAHGSLIAKPSVSQ